MRHDHCCYSLILKFQVFLQYYFHSAWRISFSISTIKPLQLTYLLLCCHCIFILCLTLEGLLHLFSRRLFLLDRMLRFTIIYFQYFKSIITLYSDFFFHEKHAIICVSVHLYNVLKSWFAFKYYLSLQFSPVLL